LAGHEVGAVGQSDVVCGEALFGSFPVADDYGFDCAYLDAEDGAMAVGHRAQEVMGGGRAR